MKLYLYRIGTSVPLIKIENVVSYTADQVVSCEADGTERVYTPLAPDLELSSLPDCSEALRAKWRAEHPEPEEEVRRLRTQVAELEERCREQDDALIELAGILGGEGV